MLPLSGRFDIKMSVNTLKNKPKQYSGKLKSIMPNRCSQCLIGIGKSMYLDAGVWKQHVHLEKRGYIFRYGKSNEKQLFVCSECMASLSRRKDVDVYIKKAAEYNLRMRST